MVRMPVVWTLLIAYCLGTTAGTVVISQLGPFARNAGHTIIMSTHQLREALELASDVALILRGRLTSPWARTSEILADPSWPYTNFGEA